MAIAASLLACRRWHLRIGRSDIQNVFFSREVQSQVLQNVQA